MILITGSSGHLGAALCIKCNEENIAYISTDLKDGTYTQIIGDLSSQAFIASLYDLGVTDIIHAATLHKPHVVTHTKQQFIEANISATNNLLQLAVDTKCRSFVFTSTTSTFGDAMRPNIDEPSSWVTEKLIPKTKNIYGLTKLAAEDLCSLYHRNYSLPCIILKTSRFFWEPDDDAIMRDNYEDQNIKVNEYLYRRVDVQDVVAAHFLALEKAQTIGFEKYIVSATSPFQKEHLKMLNKNASAVVEQIYPEYLNIYEKLGWKMFSKISRVYINEKARTHLEWQPQYDFKYLLECLVNGQSIKSDLARQIGIKGYHGQKFKDGIYPTNIQQ